MDKIITVLFAVAFIAGISLGVTWLIWLLWCWVLPQVWATGPASFIKPSFWLFVGVWLLLGFLGRCIFPSTKSA